MSAIRRKYSDVARKLGMMSINLRYCAKTRKLVREAQEIICEEMLKFERETTRD